MNPQPEKTPVVIKLHEYCFQCALDGNGEVYDRDSQILWRFKTLPKNSSYVLSSLSFKLFPNFYFLDNNLKELLVIKCEQRYPLARFVMFVDNFPVCVIRQRSILFKNKYTLEYNNGSRWFFQMPLFSVFYKGVSDTGAEVKVRLLRHDTWHVQIASEHDSPLLIAGLAFIHRERQRFA
jgi:hypothetical protein